MKISVIDRCQEVDSIGILIMTRSGLTVQPLGRSMPCRSHLVSHIIIRLWGRLGFLSGTLCARRDRPMMPNRRAFADISSLSQMGRLRKFGLQPGIAVFEANSYFRVRPTANIAAMTPDTVKVSVMKGTRTPS